ncbi:hypothetical protein ACFXGT_02350 [Streptomyces sp. NPDC059352]
MSQGLRRKAVALSRISLGDADQRLVAMLRLRLAMDGEHIVKTPLPAL